MKIFELAGQLREKTGKALTKKVRTSESIPCVLYGGEQNIHFTVTERDAKPIIYTPDVYNVHLNIDGKTYSAVMKALQFHPVSDAVLHLDFLEVKADKKMVISLPMVFEGVAEGVRQGGKLYTPLRGLKVRGLISEMPDKLRINVEKLAIGQTMKVGMLEFPGLEILDAKNLIAVAIKSTRATKKD